MPFTETDLLAVRTRLWGKASEGSLQYLGLELVSFNFEESDEAQKNLLLILESHQATLEVINLSKNHVGPKLLSKIAKTLLQYDFPRLKLIVLDHLKSQVVFNCMTALKEFVELNKPLTIRLTLGHFEPKS